MYKIIPHKRVIKFINSRTLKEKQKFLKLQENPYPINQVVDTKKLQNKNGYRLRIGSYRFIYEIIENELLIYMQEADNRGDIY